jgi:DNA-binding FadR family transcriptional regulator
MQKFNKMHAVDTRVYYTQSASGHWTATVYEHYDRIFKATKLGNLIRAKEAVAEFLNEREKNHD